MQRKFLPIILLTFVNVIGFTLLIPVLPDVAKKYVSEDIAGLVYGALISSYAIFQFIGAPILGAISDKYGRKPVLLLSQVGTTASWIIFGAAFFVPVEAKVAGIPLALLVISFSRILDGITGGNISVANAWLSDNTSREEKTKAFGMLGATFGVGFLIGPAIGGFAASTQWEFLGSAVVAFAISLFTFLLMYFRLPESLPLEKRDHELELNLWKELNFVRKFKYFKDNHFIWNLLIIRLFFSIVFASYTTVIILMLEDTFALSPAGLGAMLSLIGVFSIFNQAVVTPKLAKKIGDINTFYASVITIFISILILPLIPGELFIGGVDIALPLVMFNAYFANLGISLGIPTFKSLLTNNVADNKQGLVTGVEESLNALGQSVTPIIAGSLFAIIGAKTFYIYALILFIPNLIIWLKYGKLTPEDNLQ